MLGRRRYVSCACLYVVDPNNTDQDKEWHRDKLFHIHSSTLTDIPNGMAYTKDRIAVSTFTCVKVWLMINGGLLFFADNFL
jgi:hypothetical protein